MTSYTADGQTMGKCFIATQALFRVRELWKSNNTNSDSTQLIYQSDQWQANFLGLPSFELHTKNVFLHSVLYIVKLRDNRQPERLFVFHAQIGIRKHANFVLILGPLYWTQKQNILLHIRSISGVRFCFIRVIYRFSRLIWRLFLQNWNLHLSLLLKGRQWQWWCHLAQTHS